MKLSRLLIIFLVSCFIFPAFAIADQLEDAKAALDNKDYEKAYELFVPLAEAKNVEAQTRLGVMYVNGQGVKMDFAKGLGLIMEAANQGYDMAQVCALDVSMDLARAGDTGAMYNVGGMCLKGWGGEQDKTVCLNWLEEAARLGHENSAKILNRIFTKGMVGISPDEEKATYWKNLLAAYDAGLDGTWSGEVPNPFGGPPMIQTFTFETKGNELTGSTPGFGGQKTELLDGKIDGKDFSFSTRTSFRGTKTITDYEGEFYGDTIKLTYITKTKGPRDAGPGSSLRTTSDTESPPMTLIAKRSKL
jgi:hypothetical protein